MRKPPIDDYQTKTEWMYKNQDGFCSGCGNKFTKRPQFAHWKARTDDNLKKWPLFFDSILNATLQCAECNIGHINCYGNEPPSDLECAKIEKYLEDNLAVELWVNHPNNRDYDINGIWLEIEEYKSIIEKENI